MPLRAMSMLGLITAFTGFFGVILLFLARIIYGTPVVGWTSIMVIVLVTSGVQMLMIGVIGEYIWRTFDETRRRPHYTVCETVNIEESSRA